MSCDPKEKIKPKPNLAHKQMWKFTDAKNIYKSGARVRFEPCFFAFLGWGLGWAPKKAHFLHFYEFPERVATLRKKSSQNPI